MKIKDLFRILSYLKKEKLMIIFSLLCACITVTSSLSLPLFIGKIIDQLLGKGLVNMQAIINILLIMGVLVCLSTIANYINNQLNNHFSYRIIKRLREEAFSKLQTLPLQTLDKTETGQWLNRIITDITIMADGLLIGFNQFFTAIISILFTLIFMFSVQWKIAICVVVLTPLSLILTHYIAKYAYSYFNKQAEIRGKQQAFITESILAQKVIRAFAVENNIQQQFDVINNDMKESATKAIFISSIPNPATRFINSLIYAVVAAVGAFTCLHNPAFTIGQFTAILNYSNQYTKPFNEIAGIITELQNAIVCAKRVFDFLALDSEKIENNPQLKESIKGEIALKNVTFSYVKDKPVLHNLNLEVKAGMCVAIVGKTGCGKTTLIQLIMRFFETDEGQIILDSLPLSTIDKKELRQNIGMVLQDTWLKTGTIKDNLIMGNTSLSDEEIIDAAKKTHAHRFISKLPQGYNTILEKDGGNLSQGEKQLLCITRVMLSKPPILLLDEATSSIDLRTEKRIQRAFDKLMQDRTSFVVAHRLSTIENADLIVVMDAGHIVEKGTHKTLLNKKGLYYDLYVSQF